MTMKFITPPTAMVLYISLVLLCITAALGAEPWAPSLKLRFDFTIFNIGERAFIEVPQSKSTAESEGWETKTRPDGPAGLESLEMWCSPTDYTVCVLLDDTGYLAGLQIAISKANFTAFYNMADLGFTEWTTTLNGTSSVFYTIQQYFISADTLATEKETRIATRQRNNNTNLHDSSVWLTGFDRQLYNVSLNTSELTNGNTIYTEERCIPWMGHHYFYNMNKNLECSGKTIFPWFPLIYSNQVIGAGLVFYGNFTEGSAPRYIENPPRSLVEFIIPTAPTCVYEHADSPGVITIHIYYIENPWAITCVIE